VLNILIGGERTEIGKLFELLLWKPDRIFKNVPTLEKFIRQAKNTLPDLLIIDRSIDTHEHCFDALTTLKESQKTADIPIILLTDPARDGEEKSQLTLAVDARIKEPFNPTEIKTITEQFI